MKCLSTVKTDCLKILCRHHWLHRILHLPQILRTRSVFWKSGLPDTQNGFLTAAKAEGFSLWLSGYRSYERQEILYQKACCKSSAASSLCETAMPGCSEHQTGLALDVSCPAVSLNLSQAFSETAEGRWLARHAPLYGFIIRYPKGKEHLTKIPAEPWHIRYVTRSLALCLTLTGQVLEEYYACCER